MRWLVVVGLGAGRVAARPGTAHAQPARARVPRAGAVGVGDGRVAAVESPEDGGAIREVEARRWSHDHRRLRPPAPRHRPGRDAGVARLPRRGGRRAGQDAGPVPDVEAARAGAASCRSGTPATVSTPYVNTIPPEQEPFFPGDEDIERRIRRLHPLERGGDGRQGQQAADGHRRPPVDLRQLGGALRGRASTTSSAARTTASPATTSTSRATPRPASTPGRSSRAGSPRTSSTTSAARWAAAACRPTRTRG